MRFIIATLIAVAVTAQVSWAQRKQQPALLIVRNSSPSQNGAIMLNVFAVPSQFRGNWGKDRLGAIVVGPQSVIGIFLPSGNCIFDVRVVFDNGFSAERKAVNACTANWNNTVDINGGLYTGRGYSR